MYHATEFRVKHQGRYVNQEQLEEMRAEHGVPPPLDLETLPDKADLDPDAPLAQLYAEHKQVRRYLHVRLDRKTGQYTSTIREGLSPEEKEVALALLARYDVKRRVRAMAVATEMEARHESD